MSGNPYDVGTPPRRGPALLTKGDLEQMLQNAMTSSSARIDVPREQFQQILRSAISALAAPAAPATPAAVALVPKREMLKSDFELLLADVERLARGERMSFSANETTNILKSALKAFERLAPTPEPFRLDAYRKGFREALELFRDELGDGDLDAERLRARVEALDVVAQELAEKSTPAPVVAKTGDVFGHIPEPSSRQDDFARKIEDDRLRQGLAREFMKKKIEADQIDPDSVAAAFASEVRKSSYGKDHR